MIDTVLHSLWMFVSMRHRFKTVLVLNSEPDTKILPLHKITFIFYIICRGNLEGAIFVMVVDVGALRCHIFL
jgi:hypothetical protein